MMNSVRLLPSEKQFTIHPDQTVLDAALNQQIAFAHRCQIGICTACLCKLVDGEVEYQLEPLLTEQEKATGWILACQAYATTDLVLTFKE
ncbi:2Fe-2S iron-sulfur cluster binding domain-containing protein [Vibrio sp. HDW18]|uniref:2Fe-2S iron-sulfur cluster-binding protein n=1 Tax=Vibrio sp. HDW18 TaxID=2714948 RepID=UPI001407939A|nr:2Fe-2S iron-sulfur cluster-binding protein [Vibrio sp. HDW18]QIL85305.1 2Fe-2S iron-sulfur cluster binding domain-containing protein [Vibrio sp. HDW18]